MSEPETVAGDGASKSSVLRPTAFFGGPGESPSAPTRSADTPTAEPPPEPKSLPDIPGYAVIRKAGQGGMGIVFEARHKELDKVVALKLVFPHGRDEAAVRQRFEREVRSLARIDHKNIVPVFDAGYWQGFPFYTMRFVPGGTLGQHMGRIRADLRRAVGLVATVARAVERLHAEGVLHRDLKPMNILLGDGDEPLVADFGLAKWLGDDSGLTATGAAVGTRQYMSPEQTQGRRNEYGPACDIWAVGVILYEVLTGRPPFADDDPVELYRQIRERPPEPCSSANPDVPAALDAVVRKCLAKDPADRYSSAGAVAAALDGWLADGSGPPDEPHRPRRRWPWAVAFGCMAVAVGLAVWGLWPRDPAHAPPTVAERLVAGEVVDIDFSKGLPADCWLLPGSTGRPDLGPDGTVTLNSVGIQVLAVYADPAGPPVELQADVALVQDRVDTAWAGVFAAGAVPADPPAARQQVIQLVQKNRYRDLGANGQELTETAELMTFGWNSDGAQGRIPTDLVHRDRTTVVPPGQAEGLRWHRLTLRVTPAGVVATRDNDLMVLPPDHTPLRAAVPAPGPVVGLCVWNAEAVFRNVRLVPVPP